MSYQPFPIKIQPGLVTDASRYSLRNRYIYGDKIRFVLGQPESIGGWERTLNGDVLTGVTRTIYPFADLGGNRSIFFGTHSKAYVWNNSSTTIDITPQVSSAIYANSISTTISTNRVGATLLPGDPKGVGNFIIISGSAAVGGIPAVQINAEHEIVDVIGNTVYFDVANNATSTVGAGGGAGVTITILLPTGQWDPVASGGWGSGGWGSGGWGGGSTTVLNPIRFWSADSWGEDLLISPSDGAIYYWDKTTPTTRAVPISGLPGASQVPVAARQIMVSDQNRITIAFATNPIGSSTQDPMLIRWSDNENYLEWDPTVAGSAAGETRLIAGSVFVAALEAPNEILVWSDTAIHSMTPSGDNNIFNIRLVSPRMPVYGPRAVTIAGDAIFGWGSAGFYRYAGSVQKMDCPVEDYIKSIMDTSRVVKVVAASNTEFNEVWWFFVSSLTTDAEPDYYVKFNYVENLWDFGSMPRTAWHDADLFSKPLAVDPQGRVLFHEVGVVDASEPLSQTAITHILRTGPCSIDVSGGSFVASRWILPVIQFRSLDGQSGQIFVTPYYDRGPGSSAVTGDDIEISAIGAGFDFDVAYVPRYRMRGRGASVSFWWISNTMAAGWRMGDHTILGLKDGRK